MTHVFTAITDDWVPLWESVRPNWEEYCARHGYKLHVQREFDPSMKPIFSKINSLCSYLLNDIGSHDHVWCLDADILFTNMTIPIEERHGDKLWDFISMAKDINGLNSGVFRIGCSNSLTIVWLKTIVAMREVTTGEQHAIWILDEAFNLLTSKIEQPCFNSIDYKMYPDFKEEYTEQQGQWVPGHLLVHLPAMTLQRRIELLQTYHKHIIR